MALDTANPPAPQPAAPAPAGTGAIGDLPAGWEADILKGLGLADTASATSDLDTWLAAEGGGVNNTAFYNPFNTTLRTAASGLLTGGGPAAGAGVQAYTSWQAGLAATVSTLQEGQFKTIDEALASGGPVTAFEQAVNGTKWGTQFQVGADYSTGGGDVAGSATDTASGTDAFASVDTILQSYGLGGLSGWLQNEVTLGASEDQILLALQTTPQFQAAFPGLTQRQANGLPAISVSDYLSYTDQAMQLARAAGLPTGFMTTKEVGDLIGNDVSISELTSRINSAYSVANQAPAETKQLLSQWYGINTGDLAAYYLNPDNALPTIENQLTAAQIGTEGVTSGFGNISQDQAEKLRAAGVTQDTARSTFASLAKLGPLTQAAPGTGHEQTSISQEDLINEGFFGNNQQELQHVEEARRGPFSGGGGYSATAKGGIGAGFSSAQGTIGT